MSDQRIPHSSLTSALLDRFGNTVPVQAIIHLTRNGVYPEGASNIAQSSDSNHGSYEAATSTHITYGGMTINDIYKLGKASEKELNGVKTELTLITRLAIRLTTQDFTVYDGLRTMKEQQAHVNAGTSKTLNSKHLQGLAVDLVPWINGKPVWDWDGCYKIAQAFDAAATHLGFSNRIRWGGAWDRMLSDFGNPDDWQAYETEVSEYQRRTGKGFIDGPHFEWVN